MLIKFIDVGPDKRSWIEAIPLDDDGYLDEHAMEKSIREHCALGSREFDIGADGYIYVGNFRRVGRWEGELVVAGGTATV